MFAGKKCMYGNGTLYRIEKPALGEIDIPTDKKVWPASPPTVMAHYLLILCGILRASITITLKCGIILEIAQRHKWLVTLD